MEIPLAYSAQAVKPRGNNVNEKLQYLINWYTKTPEEERNNTLPHGLNTTQYANPIEFQDNYKNVHHSINFEGKSTPSPALD